MSRASRTRLLRLLASINRDVVGDSAFSVTLTYPHAWPEDPATWKKHLERWRKRVQRKYGGSACVWRLGFQKRGAPHFHLILFLDPSPTASTEQVRVFVAESWYEACGELCEEHLSAGTQAKRIRSAAGFGRAAKYLAKREEHKADSPPPGRFWGVWNKKLLPIEWETTVVSYPDGLRVRRALRRLAGLKGIGPLVKTQAFVEHENTMRLLAFLHHDKEDLATEEHEGDEGDAAA